MGNNNPYSLRVIIMVIMGITVAGFTMAICVVRIIMVLGLLRLFWVLDLLGLLRMLGFYKCLERERADTARRSKRLGLSGILD